MINLPEGVSVIITYQDHYDNVLRSVHKITQPYLVAKTCIGFRDIGKEFRIYPINSKTKYTKVDICEAWNEGMTLNEFEEYLNA